MRVKLFLTIGSTLPIIFIIYNLYEWKTNYRSSILYPWSCSVSINALLFWNLIIIAGSATQRLSIRIKFLPQQNYQSYYSKSKKMGEMQTQNLPFETFMFECNKTLWLWHTMWECALCCQLAVGEVTISNLHNWCRLFEIKDEPKGNERYLIDGIMNDMNAYFRLF